MAGAWSRDDYDDPELENDTIDSCDHMEFLKEYKLEEEGCWALTQTLRDEFQVIDLYQGLYRSKNILLRTLKRSCHFIMVAELSAIGRLHYHGVFRIFDEIKWRKETKRQLEKLLGHVEVRPIKQPEIWRMYYTKDMKITEAIFEHRQFRFTHEDPCEKARIKKVTYSIRYKHNVDHFFRSHPKI